MPNPTKKIWRVDHPAKLIYDGVAFFGDETWRVNNWASNKSSASRSANILKRKGLRTRITQEGEYLFVVWTPEF